MLQPARHHLLIYQNGSFEQQFLIKPGPDLTGATFEAQIRVGSVMAGCGCEAGDIEGNPIPFVAAFTPLTRTVTLTLDVATVNALKPNCRYSQLDRLVVDEEGKMNVTLLQNFDYSKLPGGYRFEFFWLHGTGKDPLMNGAGLVVGG